MTVALMSRPTATVLSAANGPEGLLDLVRNCATAGVARRVLLVRTELLPLLLAQPHHLRLARIALEPLMTAERARVHDLPHRRLAVSWRGDASALLQQSLTALEHLFGETFRIGLAAQHSLVRLFDLPEEGPALVACAGLEDEAEPTPHLHLTAASVASPPPALLPLDAAALLVMEGQLATADMARFARRKPICRLDGGHVRLAWEKRFLSISELTATLAPGRSAHADPWLFRRLTRVLDRRMLALLAATHELRGAGPFSLNLNVASVLSPEFLRFDAAVPSALQGRVVLDLLPADVLADPAAFIFARSFARARGYRLLLRNVTATLLPLLRLHKMELDFVQLRWSPALTSIDPAMLQAGTARWVLSQADEPAALQWGHDHGISLVQGRAVVLTT